MAFPNKYRSCLICGKKINLLKTDWKTCYSFDLGKFTLISGSNFCDEHKRYHLSAEEAFSIPQRITDYVEELKNELSNLSSRPHL